MSFEEWYDKEYPKGIDTARLEHYDRGEWGCAVAEHELKKMMKAAWEGRYFTLTYHDL